MGTTKPETEKTETVRFSVHDYNDEEHPIGAELAREFLGQDR